MCLICIYKLICTCIYIYIYLFVCLFVWLFVCLIACLLACLFVCLFACLFVCLFACLFVCLLVCLFVRLFSYMNMFGDLLRYLCLCVCLAMLLGFSNWSKPNVSTRIFVKSGMFVSVLETIKPSNATWRHRWICLGMLGATLKKSHKKKIWKEITETQHSVLIGFLTRSLQWLSYNPFISGSSCTTKNHILITALLSSFGWSMGKRDSAAMKQA